MSQEPLADMVRALVLAVVAHETDAAGTDELAEAAEALASRMEVALLEVAASGGDGTHAQGPHLDPRLHPVTGVANAFAAPLVDGAESGGIVTASGTFTVIHEGPPGCVHGGAIAAGFEHIVDRAEGRTGLESGPRTVTIHYRRPTLLGVPLRFEANLLDEGAYAEGVDAEGDPGLVTVSARLVQDGEVTCEARAERRIRAGATRTPEGRGG